MNGHVLHNSNQPSLVSTDKTLLVLLCGHLSPIKQEVFVCPSNSLIFNQVRRYILSHGWCLFSFFDAIILLEAQDFNVFNHKCAGSHGLIVSAE